MSDEGLRAAEGTRQRQPARPRSGLAAFALLLALAALGLAGFQYYQRLTSGPPGADGTIDSVRAEQRRQAEELRAVAETAARLEAQFEKAAAEPAPAEPANRTVAIPDRALKLVEAQYLLQSANDRMKVTGDAHDALAMALAAQALLESIEDPALADVRTSVMRDVAALRDAAAIDLDSTYDRLQALLGVIPDLPARGAHFTAAPIESTEQPPPSTATLAWRKFLSLFEFRKRGTARPPLGPDDTNYLRLNLGLMLQSAELALLRRDADVYRESLEAVRRWIDDYLDTGAPAVRDVRAEIEQLIAVRVERTHTDLSASLDALRPLVAETAMAAPPSLAAPESTAASPEPPAASPEPSSRTAAPAPAPDAGSDTATMPAEAGARP